MAMDLIPWNDTHFIDPNLLGYTQLSFEEFTEYLISMDIAKRARAFSLVATLYGPVLWSICMAGIVLNIGVIVSCLFAKCSASSILLGVISFCWIAQASSLLFLHDIFQGMIHDWPSSH